MNKKPKPRKMCTECFGEMTIVEIPAYEHFFEIRIPFTDIYVRWFKEPQYEWYCKQCAIDNDPHQEECRAAYEAGLSDCRSKHCDYF